MMKLDQTKRPLILIGLFAIVLAVLWVNYFPAQLVLPEQPRSPVKTERPNLNPFTVAHRGAALHAPENTLEAIEKAIEFGFDWVEIDVRYTSDGVPILMHDAVVGRTTNGSGWIHEQTSAELQTLDAGSWFSEEFAGTKVPTLEDALKLMQGKVCVIWHAKALPRVEVVDLFHKYGFTNGCVIIALTHAPKDEFEAQVAAINRLWLNPPLAMPVKQASSIPEIIQQYPGLRYVGVEARHAKPELVDAAHAAGLRLFTRTVLNMDNDRFYKKSLDAGVDGLMLEDIDNLRRYLLEGASGTGDLSRPKN
jgi:glycerophosphoryl diester phosphodiesterase